MKIRATSDGTVNSNNWSNVAGAEGRPVRRGCSLGFWQGILAAAFLSLLLVSVALFHALPAPGLYSDFASMTPVGRARDHSLTHYLKSGQWRADMRTLASMFNYLVTPETVTTTNRPVLPA